MSRAETLADLLDRAAPDALTWQQLEVGLMAVTGMMDAAGEAACSAVLWHRRMAGGADLVDLFRTGPTARRAERLAPDLDHLGLTEAAQLTARMERAMTGSAAAQDALSARLTPRAPDIGPALWQALRDRRGSFTGIAISDPAKGNLNRRLG